MKEWIIIEDYMIEEWNIKSNKDYTIDKDCIIAKDCIVVDKDCIIEGISVTDFDWKMVL